jgi:hypothetical protein
MLLKRLNEQTVRINFKRKRTKFLLEFRLKLLKMETNVNQSGLI